MTGGLAVLKSRDFTLYLYSRFFASIATQMVIMAVGWQVYRITGRVLDLGLIGLSQFLPFLCLVLFSGHVADQFDRRLIIILGHCAYAACTLLLLSFAWLNVRSVVPIFAVLAVLGITRAFQVPAAQSFVPTLVPGPTLRNALAIHSSTNQVAVIVGPSVGGVMYAIAEARLGPGGGAGVVYGVAAALLLLAIGMVSMIRKRRLPVDRTGLALATLLQGLHFVWQRKTVLGAISLDLFAVLFGGATALLPAYTRDVLHAGPDVFGYLRAAPGIGAGATAVWLALRPISRNVGVTLFAGVAAFGMATVVLGLTHVFWVAMAALVVLGMGDMISVFVRSLLVQLQTPDRIRGRVSAVTAVFIGASNELGEFESGTTAAWFGLVPAIVFGGVATMVVTVLWARVLFPSLWRMRTFEH
ncbi:MAG TPA: MFS transporter [Steroidobacteraceae bacterium]|nr:MFS transporter [Steroidobacteraceae bacterium]